MKRKKLLPVSTLIIIDVLSLVICLNVYALFHHVLHFQTQEVVAVSSIPARTTPNPEGNKVNTETPQPDEMPEKTDEPVEEVYDPGQFGEAFADQFAAPGELTVTDTLYVSENLRIEIMSDRAFSADIHIMDFYVRNISSFRTSFAGGEDIYDGARTTVPEMAEQVHAVAAINGDFCGFTAGGEYVVLRNGKLFQSNPSRAVCVLYYDGTMRTYWKRFNQVGDDFDIDQAMAEGAWQIWSFGPALLDEEGHQNNVSYDNVGHPRTMLGYYEPGHYCFVTFDGRTDTSFGVTLQQMAQYAEQLGLTQAFNLDGGQSSTMVFQDQVISMGAPNDGLREISDIIYLCEDPEP